MIYLIDGHNLIGKMPDISLDDPDDEEKLVRQLQQWAAANKNRQVIVIFDRGVVSGLAPHLSNAQVKAYFAPSRTAADALLINRIDNVRNTRAYRVVSSDREVRGAAKLRGIRIWRAEKFAAMLEEETRARQGQPTSEPEKDFREDPKLSDEEIAEWLRLFGNED